MCRSPQGLQTSALRPLKQRCQRDSAYALATAERRVGDLKAIIERLTVAIENGEPIEPGRIAQRRAELSERVAEVAAARRKIASQQTEISVEQRRGVIAAAERVKGEPEEVRFATRSSANHALKQLISAIHCHADGRAMLHLDKYGEHLTFEHGQPKIAEWQVLLAQ